MMSAEIGGFYPLHCSFTCGSTKFMQHPLPCYLISNNFLQTSFKQDPLPLPLSSTRCCYLRAGYALSLSLCVHDFHYACRSRSPSRPAVSLSCPISGGWIRRRDSSRATLLQSDLVRSSQQSIINDHLNQRLIVSNACSNPI